MITAIDKIKWREILSGKIQKTPTYLTENAKTRLLVKAGVHVNLSEILVSLKRGWKGKKRVMEHHQTVAWPHNGTPGCWATVWSVWTNF